MQQTLSIEGMAVDVLRQGRWMPAVADVSFGLDSGRMAALVGESGAGKTLVARAIAGTLPASARAQGRVELSGVRLDDLPRAPRREITARRIGYVFQEPLTALDPVVRVGDQLLEALRIDGRSAGEGLELMQAVGFTRPEVVLRRYPHELSGGMCARFAVALALARSPDVLIADEPTSALDGSAARALAALFRELCRRRGLAVLFVTHDLALASDTADEILVMYAGRLVERGPCEAVFRRPSHPYSQALRACMADLTPASRRPPFATLPGRVPPPGERLGARCDFSDRCHEVFDRCREKTPPEFPAGSVRSRCFLHEGRT